MAQTSTASMIGTQQLLQSDARNASVIRVASILAREDVASQLVRLGVDPQAVQSRVGNMTDSELFALEGKLDKQVAGGDAIAVIGVVFLVLIILEFVGVTDIFKKA
jgi:hypothetical protein